MTTNEKIQLIEKLVDQYKKLNDAFDKFSVVVGPTCEGELFNAAWRAFDSYTDVVSELVNDPDHYIAWYIFDNRLGANNFEVRWVTYDRRSRKRNKQKVVKTVKDLVYVIEATQLDSST
jgi:hypothetical protein